MGRLPPGWVPVPLNAEEQKGVPKHAPANKFDFAHARPAKRLRLSSQRPLRRKHHARTPQRIPLRMPVRMLERRGIRVGGHGAEMARARHRRGLRQPRRITDRAEVHRSSANGVADRL